MLSTATAPTEQRPATDFLQTIFAAGDRVMFRPIESWIENGQKQDRVDYKGVQYVTVNSNTKILDYPLRAGWLNQSPTGS